jgi:hypothetical protein
MAAMTDQQPARITIMRRDPADVRQRQIVTSLDGEPLGTLLFGEAVTREIPAGTHRLRAHNTLFWKTRQITVGPGEHVRFKVVNRAGFGTYSLLGLLGVGPLYLTLEPEGGPPGGSQR